MNPPPKAEGMENMQKILPAEMLYENHYFQVTIGAVTMEGAAALAAAMRKSSMPALM